MADPRPELKEITAQMGKKGTFIQAANKLTGFVQSSYKSGDDAIKTEIFTATKRAAHLLRSRYTVIGFWRAGKALFQAQYEAADGNAERCKSAKEWLELAEAEVGATEERENAPTLPPSTSTSQPRPEAPPTQQADTRPPGVFLAEGLESMIRDVDLEQLLQMLGSGAPILGEGGGDSGPPPASREARFNLGVKTVDGGVVCAVCQEEFPPKGKAKVMPCGHPFHYDCLMEWLERHNSCPTCRYALPTEKPAFDLAAERVLCRCPACFVSKLTKCHGSQPVSASGHGDTVTVVTVT